MRAAVLHTYGGPDVLNIEQRPEPALRDTDILVEVHATSVNPVDTKVRQTGGGGGRTLPLILGYDVSGVVVRCGSDVNQWKPGDEVFAAPNLFRDGANADYVAIDGRSAARKPKTVDHATAASLPLVSQTAWEALHLRARIQPGQTVLIHAGADGHSNSPRDRARASRADPDRHRAIGGLGTAAAVGEPTAASRAGRGRPSPDRDQPDHRQGCDRRTDLAARTAPRDR